MQNLSATDSRTEFYLKSRVYLHHHDSNPKSDGDAAIFGYDVDKAAPAKPDQDALVYTIPGCDYAFGVYTENESNNLIEALYATLLSAIAAGKPVWTQITLKSDDIT